LALPQPLAPSDASRIRRILALQAHGAIEAAARETDQLDTASPLGQAMLGLILADRYLGRFTRPDVATLAAWLGRWPDLPDASAIYALMLSRLPRGSKPPGLPPAATLLRAPSQPPAPVPEETGAGERALARNPDLDRSVAAAARSRGAAGVRRLLARTSGLTGGYASQLAGEAGRILFTLNRDQEAFDIAAEGVRACRRWPHPHCQVSSLAGYVAGLAAWRLQRPEQAGPMFEAAWRASITTSALRASSAFWAARAHLGGRDPASYLPWMQRAAAERDTFYGLLARRILQAHVGLAPGERQFAADADAGETIGEADLDAVAASPQGLRAFALLQVGKPARAEAELRRLWPTLTETPPLARAVMLVADRAGLSELAADLADLLQTADGRPREATRFRVPHLAPDGGFRVDPALILALARTESNFDARETSSAGARGIMQIMPETADFIVSALDHAALREARLQAMLQDPEANMALGQEYVMYLSGRVAVAGDLIRLLASYNCGPGKFGQWSDSLRDGGDPLLFVEAIPIDETRAFVPRVLTYTWLYAARLRLPTPSLDELAAGEWPRYHPLRPRVQLARLH
jgi:soluble lytic murein transglycosylase-like protein